MDQGVTEHDYFVDFMWLTSALMSWNHASKTHQAVPLLTFYCCTGDPGNEATIKPSSSDPFMFSELVCTNW